MVKEHDDGVGSKGGRARRNICAEDGALVVRSQALPEFGLSFEPEEVEPSFDGGKHGRPSVTSRDIPQWELQLGCCRYCTGWGKGCHAPRTLTEKKRKEKKRKEKKRGGKKNPKEKPCCKLFLFLLPSSSSNSFLLQDFFMDPSVSNHPYTN